MLASSSFKFNLQIFLASLKKTAKIHLGWWSLLGGLLLIFHWPCTEYPDLQESLASSLSSSPAISLSPPLPNGKVVIGLVSCPLQSGQNSKLNEEASVTIKSIIMSARMYGVPAVEFHLFLEDIKGHRPFFLEKLREFGVGVGAETDENGKGAEPVDVQMIFHSAFDVVPKKYHEGMVYHPTHRCGFVRMFFPSALPDIDSILYLDTDMIVTGNIAKLWERLSLMKGEELVGVARNNEPEDRNYGWLDKQGFGDIPHVAPKGLNSGMLLMNLTRMREYGWEERITRLFKDYGKIVMLNDQRLLNILLYFDPGLLHLVPCQFDLMHTHCDLGWICPSALEDPYGIHLIHGACDMFDVGKSFYPIYKTYLEANLTGNMKNDKNMFRELTENIRDSYFVKTGPTEKEIMKPDSQCYGTLNKILFKNLVS